MMSALKVAMVSEHASPLAVLGGADAGGQNVHVAALAQAVAAAGAEVVVHTRRDEPDSPRVVPMAPGVAVDHVTAGPSRPVPKDALLPHMDAFAADLRRRWIRDRPDVVHAHFWMSGLASLAAARPLGIPVVQTFHALGVVKRREQGAKDTSPPQRLGLEEHLVRSLDHIVAQCTDEVFELLRMGAGRERITIVPSGVDVSLFHPDGPAAPRSSRWRHRIVFFGRLVERKGVGNAITALADAPDTELVVAGGPDPAELDSDPAVRRLRDLARRHGVADRVLFLGRVDHDDMPPLVRSADLAVTVPWYEPFGITPLEAMACGVPVVASAVGGLIDTVVDGETGLHVPPRKPAAVAAAVNTLLADPPLRRRMGAAGARRTRRRFTWERSAAAVLQLYEEMLFASTGVTHVGAGRPS